MTRPRGPVFCTCAHTRGWHFRGNVAGRCTAVACTCAAFTEAHPPTRNKYGARKTRLPERPGEVYDSGAEARWARDVLLREAAGEIVGLRFHPRYVLEVNGVEICQYEADADWTERDSGEVVVADLKGVVTDAFRLKRRLMRACLGIDVLVIPAANYRKGGRR